MRKKGKKTTEEFIREAKKIHGDKYDYSKTIYEKSQIKVEIVCPKHGSFWVTPNSHLQGRGCLPCANEKKHCERTIPIKERIKQAKSIHGDKYDYSLLTESVNMKTKVPIICPIHGIFYQALSDHIHGRNGCPKCCGKNKTTEEFIAELKSLYGNKYDYSNVIYVNNKTLVNIVCPDHGLFQKTPNTLLLGQCCPICGRIKQGNNTADTTESFIKKAREVYGNKYDYSKTVYTRSTEKITVTCPIHGDFQVRPVHHLSGVGCHVCDGNSRGEHIIGEYFKANDIYFDPQHRFIDCRDKRTLPFDFYLPDYNLCIEFHGIQHYKKNKQFKGNIANYYYIRNHDKIKADYCRSHDINLLVIPYFEFSNIDKILDETLKRIENE